MKKFKIIRKLLFLSIIGIAFLIIPLSGFCQLNDNSTQILDQVATKTKSYKTIKINFLFKHEKNKTVQKTVKGLIQVKGNKYIYTFENQVLFCDGKTTWTYSEETNEVTINNASTNNSDDNINPAFFLDDYKLKFKPKLIRESLINGKMVQIIDLSPVKSKSYSRIRLEIDKTKQQIMQMTIIDKEGDFYIYAITGFITNTVIDDSIFVFDPSKYKNIEIIDMR